MPPQEIKVVVDPGEITLAGWENFVLGHPEGNFFNLPAAWHFFSHCNNFDPFVVAAVNDKGVILGLLSGVLWQDNETVKGKLFRRAIIWGSPLMAGGQNDCDVAGRLLEELDKICGKKAVYTEIRNFYDTKGLNTCLDAREYRFYPHYNCLLSPSAEQSWNNLSDSKKRQVKSSLKQGAEISPAVSVAEVKEFYGILKNLYSGRIGKPLPGFAFFKEFYHGIQGENKGAILLARAGGKVIGGAVCPFFDNKVIYEWYNCGDDRNYKALKIYPSVLTTWGVIDYAIKNGFQKVDFMGAGKPGTPYGVRSFKERFGGELYDYGRYLKINNNFLYQTGRIGLAVLKKLKTGF